MRQQRAYPGIRLLVHAAFSVRAGIVFGKRFLLIALLIAGPAALADIYKWKDADGKTHVADRPPADQKAERLQIRAFDAPAPAPSAARPDASPRVVMLSAVWCGVCDRARAWLTQNHIPFTEYDVERTETGKAEFRRLAGKGVPIILVGEQRMTGFSAQRLQAMLQNAK